MFLIKVNNFKSHIKGVVVSEPQILIKFHET